MVDLSARGELVPAAVLIRVARVAEPAATRARIAGRRNADALVQHADLLALCIAFVGIADPVAATHRPLRSVADVGDHSAVAELVTPRSARGLERELAELGRLAAPLGRSAARGSADFVVAVGVGLQALRVADTIAVAIVGVAWVEGVGLASRGELGGALGLDRGGRTGGRQQEGDAEASERYDVGGCAALYAISMPRLSAPDLGGLRAVAPASSMDRGPPDQ